MVTTMHPLCQRITPHLIQDIILVMEPATILGALAGTYANKLLASWITTTLLSVVMAYMTYTLLRKGIKAWALETARAAQHRHDTAEPLLGDVQTAGGGDSEEQWTEKKDGGQSEGSGSGDIEEETEVGPLVRDLQRLSRAWSVQRRQQLPTPKIAVLVALFLGACAAYLLRG